MKKRFITFLILLTIVFIGIFTHKKETKFDKFTTVKIENNPFDFGVKAKKDTIKHSFKIQNITKTLFVIEKILPSCSCTITKIDKKTSKFNEFILVDVVYIPKSNEKGKVKKIIYIQCNAEKGVLKLELKGLIK